MPNLVRNVVYVERIPHRRINTRLALRLDPANARHAHSRQSAARGAQDVSNVVVRAADHRVEVRLVLGQQGAGVAIAVGLGGGIGIDDPIVLSDQHQANPHLCLITLPSRG